MKTTSSDFFMYGHTPPQKHRGRNPNPLSLQIAKLPIDEVMTIPFKESGPIFNLVHAPSGHLKRNYPDRKFRIMRDGATTKVLRVK